MGLKKKIFIIGSLMCFLLLGCTEAKTPSNLIKKPEVSLEQKEFSDIIDEFLSDEEVLTLVASAKDETPIKRIDIDRDGLYEILLPYKSNIQENTYGIKILKRKKDKWHEINEITGFNNGFDFMKNIDLTNDKKPEIIIGIMGESEFNSHLNVYSYHNGYFSNIYSAKYDHLSIEDLNNDGHKELIILNREKKNHSFVIQVLSLLNNEIKWVDRYVLKSNAYLSNMRAGNVNSKEKGIFLDLNIGGQFWDSTILVMRNNKLVKALNEGDTGYKFLKEQNIVGSEDINKDGIIEVGILKKMRDRTNIYDMPVVKYWYQWDGEDDFILTYKEYDNYDIGYKIEIPKEWREDYKIQEKETTKFYSLNDSKRINDLIFQIQYFSSEEWEKGKSEMEDNRYMVLDHHFKGITIGILSDMDKSSKFYIDEERLKNLFSKL